MAYKRQFGEVGGTQNTCNQSLGCQFLIDTLPIRIACKSLDCITRARSNRHSSEGLNRRQNRDAGAAFRPEFIKARRPQQIAETSCYDSARTDHVTRSSAKPAGIRVRHCFELAGPSGVAQRTGGQALGAIPIRLRIRYSVSSRYFLINTFDQYQGARTHGE